MNAWHRRTIHAPTGRLGNDRRRSSAGPGLARLAVAVAVGAACVLTVGCLGSPVPERAPLTTEVIGAILRPTVDDGPPIECRGLDRERCTSVGSFEGELGGVARTAIARVIVSCEGSACDARGGAMRLDLVLRDGSTVEVARGGYGEFRQP